MNYAAVCDLSTIFHTRHGCYTERQIGYRDEIQRFIHRQIGEINIGGGGDSLFVIVTTAITFITVALEHTFTCTSVKYIS